MATRPVLLAVLVLAVPAAAEGPSAPPAALLVPAGPAYPLEPRAAGAPEPVRTVEEDASPVADVTAPRITEVSELPGERGEAASAGEPTGEVPASEPPAPLTPSQREALRFQMRGYLRQVHERVGAAWAAPVTPARAPRREALVTVVIARDGRVVDARVDRSSRDEGFDRSALRTLGRPFLLPPLPPYYETDVLEVGLRFADPARPARR